MDPRFSYREAAVRGASPVQLVIYLYQQAIEDVRRAIAALQKHDIETRTRMINHALKVIGQLQGTIDMERGGEIAKNLHRFYNAARSGLIEAQIKQSASILEQQIQQLTAVHEAWLEVERATASPAQPPASPIDVNSFVPPGETRLADWNA